MKKTIKKKANQLTDIEKQAVVTWYTTHTMTSTAAKFNMDPTQIMLLLTDYGVPKHTNAEAIKLGCLEKYGVENIAQSERYKQRIKTRPKDEVSKSTEKRKATNVTRYGVEHVLQVDDINSKAKQTCMERYGAKNFAQSEYFRDALRDSNMRIYGVEHPMKLNSFKQQYIQTCLDKYGTTNYSKTATFKLDQLTATLDRFKSEEFKRLFNDRAASIKFLEATPRCTKELSDYFEVSIPTIEGWLVRNELKDYIVHKQSHYEDDIRALFPNFKLHNRTALGNGQEIDLYDEEKKVGIEFNGTYWHCSLSGVPKNYHFEKSKTAQQQGIRLIHIYEHEWNDETKRPIIESMIKIALGDTPRRIYARNCVIKEITNKEAKPFNDRYHLQGHRHAQVTYGLFYNEKLVQLMSFSRTRYNKNLKCEDEWEIIRGCPGSNNIVVGGVGKLFHHFIETHNPTKIFSYCDFNKFDGTSYEAIGMKFVGYTGPNKWWVINDIVVNRNPAEYQQLKKVATGELWGAGSKKYEWRKGECN